MTSLFLSWKKRIFYTLITPLHRVMRWLYRPKRRGEVKRILLSNTGTLGDVFLMTGLIPSLKEKYPGCEIGALVSPASKVVVDGCPGVDRIHLLSHWLGGDGSKLWNFIRFHFQSAPRLVKELKKERYDCALHTYPFFSDLIPLFLRAGIPVRSAFDNGGYRSLSTQLVSWEEETYFGDLLPKMIGEEKLHSPWIDLDLPKPIAGEYILFHVGSADVRKELSPQFWRELHKELEGERIVTTGKGKRQEKLINSIGMGESMTQLNWLELLGAVKHAKLVISIDTVTIHLAASLGVPYIVLYQFTPHPVTWFPGGKGQAFLVSEEEGLAQPVAQTAQELVSYATRH